MKYYVGTSGYMISQSLFYEQNVLNSVEINSSFYRIPKPSTVEKWKALAPSNFKFSVKVNRALTHYKKLSRPDKVWKEFWDSVKLFDEKLGVILFQFPPSFHNTDKKSPLDKKTNFERIQYLKTILPDRTRFAFEFRNTSWFTKEVYALFRKNGWAIVNDYVDNKTGWMGDMPSGFTPDVYTGSFNYIRLHGSAGKFKGAYNATALNNLKKDLTSSGKKTSYVYFNNTFFKKYGKTCKIKSKKIRYAAYCDAAKFTRKIK